jgi:predicted RNase H-like HicB family nuclease
MTKTHTAVVERSEDTGLHVGYVPGFPGAHSQVKTLDKLNENLRDVPTLADGTARLSKPRLSRPPRPATSALRASR